MFVLAYSYCICSLWASTLLALPADQWAEFKPLSHKDYELLLSLPTDRSTPELPGFKRIYVDKHGHINKTADPHRDQITIFGSPKSSKKALTVAAGYIATISKYMPQDIYHRLAVNTWTGLFTKEEKPTVYPELYRLKNGNCGTSCSGKCRVTCTVDGRKWEDIAGIGGNHAFILQDNVLCNMQDPYVHKMNSLIHEFTHTVHRVGVDNATKSQIQEAYAQAKEQATWMLRSYAMLNEREYFAVSATVFTGVNKFSRINGGGMNWCGNNFCKDEATARSHLKDKDPQLFKVLAKVFTGGHGKKMTGLTICPPK